MDNNIIYYIITGTTFIISLTVSTILKNKFNKYSKLYLQNGLNGKEIAEKMLVDNNIYDVKVISIEGELTDHYNPINKTINLSQDVYINKNAAAAAVAAHECGHAIQHKIGYSMLNLRSKLIPAVNISSKFSNIAIMIGLTIFYSSGNSFLLKIGIALFSIAVIFSFITLPVEFDASKRALLWLKNKNIVTYEEYYGAKNSLNWAATTYVVAALGAFAQLIYFASLLNNNDDDSKK